MVQENPIGQQMLNALELFHYSYRFRSETFFIVLHQGVTLDELITDIRILETSHIQIVLLCLEQSNLEEKVKRWAEDGLSLKYFKNKVPLLLNKSILAALKKRRIPVIDVQPKHFKKSSFEEFCLSHAISIKSSKIFFIQKNAGLIVEEKFLSNPSLQQLNEIIYEVKKANYDAKRVKLFLKYTQTEEIDIVLLDEKSGDLFKEIFTHKGAGTLITKDYLNEIRRAKVEDIVDIYLLIKQHISNGMILEVSETEIRENIDNYYVYTINKSIVATAMLKDFGEDAELAKFCTLPRYQGKGRAKELALSMINEAAKAGKKRVFALSVSEKMWGFFENLGFDEVDRLSLPEAWQKNYDFYRPSKALRKNIVSN